MLTLTREVRFAIPLTATGNTTSGVNGYTGANGYAGVPPIQGPSLYYRLEVTLTGALNPQSQYLLNIKTIDDAVRTQVVPFIAANPTLDFQTLLPQLLTRLTPPPSAGPALLAPATVSKLTLHLSPFQSLSLSAKDPTMLKLNLLFEFSAAHRLHNPTLSPEENLSTFGKCNNPLGHGHNYQVQITVAGPTLPQIAHLEHLVTDHLIKAYDHKHLNLEVEDFKTTIPSVENIATAAFKRLKPHLPTLTAMTVWETPKTWAEYTE